MIHFTSPAFWALYEELPFSIQKIADRSFEVLKSNPHHPSLHFKNIGKYKSVRIGIRYRALAVVVDEGLLWFWIGTHSEYDKLIH